LGDFSWWAISPSGRFLLLSSNLPCCKVFFNVTKSFQKNLLVYVSYYHQSLIFSSKYLETNLNFENNEGGFMDVA